MVKRFDVFMCDKDGTEKPCVVISPDELTAALSYVIVAPITALERDFPCRVGVRLRGRQAQIALDMIQTVPKASLTEKIGLLPQTIHAEISVILKQVFCD